jgi:hypothetical protein
MIRPILECANGANPGRRTAGERLEVSLHNTHPLGELKK